ncbi:glycosyltransferase [Agromyces protaetiae]|uniref:Glycosyltransferase n=1 Tax=Agromyces protaetiae TaxID=2509455 RepID=A0A4P6FVS7_9MICO|nr:glycosyltransferase [Agromyces protaetiae]QAY74718.1 glycosyltransferase [Agromyces protaetiae]
MARILYVTTYSPQRSDLGGAAWVDRQIIERLRERFEVDVFVVVDDNAVNPVPLEVRRSRWSAFRTLLRMILRREPYQAAKFRWSPNWNSRAAELVPLLKSDSVVVTSQWPALLMLSDLGVASVLHIAHNVDYVIADAHDPRVFSLVKNARRMRRVEFDLLRRPARVLALSAADSDRLRSGGVEASQLRLSSGAESRTVASQRRIGFVGKATWPPNAEAIEALTKEVMPAVRARIGISSPSLVLAGRGSERWASRDVRALGALDKLDEFYAAIDLVVVPRMGPTTGISVKLLEALEHGVHVIAPSALIQDAGIEAGCTRADTPAEVAEAVIRYYGNHLPSSFSPSPRKPEVVRSEPIELQDLPEYVAEVVQ